MKKFWDWMEKKEYTNGFFICDKKYIGILIDDDTDDCIPTIQMLVGYMIEYLAEKGRFIGMASASAKDIRNDLGSFETIEKYHDRLVEEIERIK